VIALAWVAVPHLLQVDGRASCRLRAAHVSSARARGANAVLSSIDSGSAGPGGGRLRSMPHLIALAAIGTVATALFLRIRDLGLLGFDSYPLIAASRVRSLADLPGLLTDELMPGYYSVAFWRPLVKLTFAADHALWGLEPAGYHLTSVLVLAACAVAIYALGCRLAGDGASLVPLVAVGLFLLHPVLRDVVPIPPRRAELLCCGFMALSLWLQLSPQALRRKLPVWPAVATLAAIASKETAFALPLASFTAVALYAPATRASERFGRAAAALVPHAAVVLAMLGARTALGAIGVEGLSPRAVLQSLVGSSPNEPLLTTSAAGRWVLVGLIITLLVGIAVSLFGWVARRTGDRDFPSLQALRPEIVAVVWSLSILALTYARWNPWKFEYQYLVPVAGWALLVAATAGRVVRFARGGGTAPAIGGVVMLGLLALQAVQQARFSPLFFERGESQAASEIARAFLDEARSRIERADDGSVVAGPRLPRRVPPRDPLRVSGTMIFADYSVQAWADLSFPDRRVRVVFAPGTTPASHTAAAGELVLLLAGVRPES